MEIWVLFWYLRGLKQQIKSSFKFKLSLSFKSRPQAAKPRLNK